VGLSVAISGEGRKGRAIPANRIDQPGCRDSLAQRDIWALPFAAHDQAGLPGGALFQATPKTPDHLLTGRLLFLWASRLARTAHVQPWRALKRRWVLLIT